MMKTIRMILLISAFVLLLASSLVLAQSGGPYQLTWTSISGGGGEMTGGAYSLVSSIAQPDAGDTQSGGGYSLNGGVIDAGSSGTTTTGGQQLFVPLILK